MTSLDCPFEGDVLNAVATGRWPDRAAPDLRAHVARCPLCDDAARVAAAFDGEPREDLLATRLPDASLVWWSAQIRARQEAVRTATRPVTVAQAAALCALVGVVGAVFGATTSWFQTAVRGIWLAGAAWLAAEWPVVVSSAVAVVAAHLTWILAGAACALLVPVAVYLAVPGED